MTKTLLTLLYGTGIIPLPNTVLLNLFRSILSSFFCVHRKILVRFNVVFVSKTQVC